MLLVKSGLEKSTNQVYSGIVLVGYGKHGADGIIESYQTKNKTELYNHEITLAGTLIYRDGKTLMEIIFVKEKETLGTWRFKEDKGDRPMTINLTKAGLACYSELSFTYMSKLPMDFTSLKLLTR